MRKIYNNFISRFIKERTYNYTYSTLTDNTHIEIENCKKILEYNEFFIKLRTSTITMCIWGSDLKISDYNTDGLIVNGNFTSIEFEDSREAE